MNLLRCVLVLLSTTVTTLCQSAPQSQQALSLPRQARALVQSFYRQVVIRKPGGLPEPADMKIFAPYLSQTLLHRIDLARACEFDWYRQHPEPDMKPEMAWLEAGLFSGQNERTGPGTFQIERTELEKADSFRVYVRLTGGIPPEKPWIWQVAAIVVRENRYLVVDDVIYLKDKDYTTESRLSALLATGCEGSRWVGYRDPF